MISDQTTPTEAEIMGAYRAGMKAHADGLPRGSSYYPHPALHHAFHAGWLKGEIDELGKSA